MTGEAVQKESEVLAKRRRKDFSSELAKTGWYHSIELSKFTNYARLDLGQFDYVSFLGVRDAHRLPVDYVSESQAGGASG